jgi:hypothetical protein
MMRVHEGGELRLVEKRIAFRYRGRVQGGIEEGR